MIRVGLVGCGNMGRSLTKGLGGVKGAKLTAVYDVNPEAASTAAADLEATAFDSVDALAASGEIDAALIACPPFVRKQAVLPLVEAGLHVFCEKPLAVELADCDAILAAAKSAGVKLMVGHVCRFHAVHGKVKELATTMLGTPTCMTVHRLSPGWGDAHPPWRYEFAKCGGALMEINAHELDFLRWVCGDVVSVSARGGHFRNERMDYPDIALVLLQFANGAVGCLHSSLASAVGGYGGRLDGTEGSIVFPAFWGAGAQLTYGRFDGKPQSLGVGDLQVENPVQHEVRAFVESVANDTTPPVTGADGRAVVEIAQAAYRSLETGREVALPLSS